MSDPQLPPSSSPSSSDAGPRRTSPHAALAFLVHSPNTVANDLPPDVDNRPLARQKRRRTSKEDEDILKEYYLKDPKPDKAIRLEIVTKVALGEKEVQIWFQNKRQNDRRRSRPLEPSSSFMSDASNMSDPVAEDDCDPQEMENVEGKSDGPTHPEKTVQSPEAESTTAPPETVKTTGSSDQVAPAQSESQTTVESTTIASTDPATADTAPTEPSGSQQSLSSSQDVEKARSSWISNRRSASFRLTEDYAPEVIAFPNSTRPTAQPPTEPTTTTRSLKRAHSYVRLSMTDDGAARVITDADKTPSPPHAKTNPATFSRAAASLRRSYSAAGLNERLAGASRGEPTPKIPRTASFGRSGDSRVWEFFCDPDARNSRSLTTRADQEGSGSAADAIGLLRANRRVLGQNQARQNAPMISRHDSSQPLGDHGAKKPRAPIQRASTSYGRLQTKDGKKSSGDETEELPQTESDKENWEPDVPPQSRRPRQRAPHPNSQRPRQILGENTDVMSQSSSLGAMMAKEKGTKTSDPEQDEELRAFMGSGGSTGRTTVSSAEEAGCVEGLLKLRNWR